MISLILNKVLLSWLLDANDLFLVAVLLTVFVMNFMILARSVDKIVDHFKKMKRKIHGAPLKYSEIRGD